MKDKLNKITLAPKRNEELENKSQTSFVKKYPFFKIVLKTGRKITRRSSITIS